jgi:hypothetical protein
MRSNDKCFGAWYGAKQFASYITDIINVGLQTCLLHPVGNKGSPFYKCFGAKRTGSGAGDLTYGSQFINPLQDNGCQLLVMGCQV